MNEKLAAEVVDEIVTETEVVESDDKTTEEVSEELAKKESEPSESSTEKKEDKKDGVQERIDELTKLRRETERDRDYWREQAQKKEPEQKVETKPIEPGKTLADFEYDEAKFTDYIMTATQAEARRVVETETNQNSASRRQADFQIKEAAFVAKTEDYLTVTQYNRDLAINEKMAEAIQDSDVGPELYYHLGQNTDESKRLFDLPPLAMAREIGRLEAKLSVPVEKKLVSDAPTPAPKLKVADAKITKELGDLSQNEFEARRRKTIANR